MRPWPARVLPGITEAELDARLAGLRDHGHVQRARRPRRPPPALPVTAPRTVT